jgi:hypothetical protein
MVISLLLSSCSMEEDTLSETFRNPPQDARPQVWWHWMYGNITEEGITKDLELMKKLGISGVTQFHNAWTDKGSPRATPRGPVVFMSPEYQDLVQYAIEECDRLGLTMGLQICDGFSQTGGPWITPEMGMRKIQYEVIPARGGKMLSTRLPDKTVAIFAYPGTIKEPPISPPNPIISPGDPYLTDENKQAAKIDMDQSIPLTDQRNGQMLTWDPPHGHWVVLVFYETLHPATNHPASPEGYGLEANKLNSEAIDLVFDNYVGKLIENAGEMAGKTLQHVLIDSWECGYQSWTEGFSVEFKKLRGYDPTPWLPVLAGIPINSIEESNRFLCDFRVTLDDLAIQEYYSHIRERLNQKGMQLHAEVLYGWHQMFGSSIRQYGVVDVPMNEIWMKKQFPGNKHRNLHGRAFTGYAATSAHVYGKPIVQDESFTVGAAKGDFSFVPSIIKSAADYVLCRGTNRFVLHTSVHQPANEKPGWTHAFNGVNFHRGNTWWPYADGFIDYLSRCSAMMQQGVFVADVIRYIGHEDTYSEGYGELPVTGLPPGYRADHCDNTVMLERMDVKDGRIVLADGISYAVLLLADKKTMTPEILEKLAELLEKGATIIGPKPEHSPGLTNFPECDAEVKRLADQLWGEKSGKIRDIPIREALREKKLEPDFSYQAPPRESAINFIHRKLPDADIYFIATAGEGCVAECSFRVSGKYPQYYDPMTGEIYDVPEYEEDASQTHIKIELEDQGSRLIVFRNQPAGRTLPTWEEKINMPFPGPWKVDFEAGRGAPEKIQMNALTSWTEHSDFGVRHFSGVGTYTTSFQLTEEFLKENTKIWIDLGDVKELAEIVINGKSLGTLWRPPFRVDISKHIDTGQNQLEIRVINTWVNRLIGDKKVPKEKRICQIVPADPSWYSEESKLLPSGLLGPVTLKASYTGIGE